MKLRSKVLIVLVTLLLLVFTAPLVIPIPPLENTVPPEQLADRDSRFIELQGILVHYKLYGGGEPLILLLHGFAASTFSWREVFEPLSERGTVVAFDRPGFGLTERPLPDEWEGRSPYSPDAQSDLTAALIEALGFNQAVLVGHSAGGAIAVRTALQYPSRVAALIMEDASIYETGGAPWALEPLLDTPQMRRLGPWLVRGIRSWGNAFAESAWHNPAGITPEVWRGYLKPLRADNWDVGLWELIRANQPPPTEADLIRLRIPVLVLSGRQDQIVPVESSVRLAEALSDSRLATFPDCGHIPHEECPEDFLNAVLPFFSQHFGASTSQWDQTTTPTSRR